MALFRESLDQRVFLGRLSEVCSELEADIFAYCLMTNHIHLVVRQGTTRLGTVMHRLLLSYAQYFNRKHGRVGHVFQNRYFSRMCRNDRYLMAVARYVHLNPVKAGLVAAAADWPWSSHREYLGLPGPQLALQEPVLSLFGGSRAEFGSFVDGASLDELPEPGSLLDDGGAVWEPLEADKAASILDNLAQETCRSLGLPEADLLRRSNEPRFVAARELFVDQARRAGCSGAAIACRLDVSPAAVSGILRRLRARETAGATS